MVSPVTLLAPAPAGPAQRPAARGNQGDLFAATLAAQDVVSGGSAGGQGAGPAHDASVPNAGGQPADGTAGGKASAETGHQWLVTDGAHSSGGDAPADPAAVPDGEVPVDMPVDLPPGATPETSLPDGADAEPADPDAAPGEAEETGGDGESTDAPTVIAPVAAENLEAADEDISARNGRVASEATPAAAETGAAARPSGSQEAAARVPATNIAGEGSAAPASSPAAAGPAAPAPQAQQSGATTVAGQSAGLPAAGAAAAETMTAEPATAKTATADEAAVPARPSQAPVERPLADGAVRPVDLPAAARTEGAARAEAPAPAAPPAPPAPVANQLAGALARLKTAPDGHHVLNIRVDPDDLGPVRVSAHIGPEGVRIELFGATDSARDALRGALSELRRDLAATGLQAELELGSREGSADRSGTGDQTPGAPGGGPARPAPTTTPRTVPLGSTGLDLLA